ncbi:MAG: tetratricopeptide repeat protein [Alphaproteobacteria bacterium]|nr:tetratricopeptide repeat protein [Alphaproteobacteria bacterium]
MPAVGPTLARTFGVGALALYVAAWVRLAVLVLGADIVPIAIVGGGALAGASLGPALPLRRTAAALAAMICGGGALALVALLSAAVLPLSAQGRFAPVIVALIAAIGAAPLGALLRSGARGALPAPLPDVSGLVLGAALGWSSPPLLAGVLAAALATLAARPERPAGRTVDLAVEPARALPVAVATAALLHGVGTLQTLADPSAGAAAGAVLIAAVVAALVRALGPRSAAAAAVLALAGLLAVDVALWKGVGLARLVVLDTAPWGASLPPYLSRWVPMGAIAAIAGGALGLAWGPHPHGFGALVGVLLGAVALASGPELSPTTLVLVGGASAVFWSLSRGSQAGGVLVAAGAAVVLWVGGAPSSEALSAPAWRLMRSDQERMADTELRGATVDAMSRADARGAVDLRVATDDWDSARGAPAIGARVEWFADAQGLRLTRTSRATEAERFGGALAALLAEQSERVLVLGDDSASALAGLLEHPVGAVTTATPAPDLVRAIADVSPQRSAAWLDPRVQLVARHPETLLRASRRVDVIVDVIRAPWGDALHAAPSPAHFDAVADRLRDGGVYVLVLHLDWLPAGAAPAIAGQVAARFPVVQGWLPPYGADTLILVAGDRPHSYDPFAARLADRDGLVASLGARSPADVASLAVVDRRGLQAWEQASSSGLPSPFALGPAVRARPVLHLSDLAGHTGTPESLWTLADDDDVRALTVRLDARRRFLELLAEATTGNMEAVFRKARELQESGGGLGADALEPLIEPHLRDARRAITLAEKEGIESKQWDEALRFGTTARMLAPTSPRPLVVLGEISLGRGNPEQAERSFEQALELDPRNAEALTGKARVAYLRGDGQRALDAFQEATRAEPDNWRIWLNLGQFQGALHEFEAAEASIGRAIQLSDGRMARPYEVLAQTMLDQGRSDAALLTANKALDIEESGMAWFLRGRAHYELGESARALDDFRRAIIEAPGFDDPRFGVGMILLERGELEQAAESFRMALRLNPAHTGARLHLDLVEEELRIREEQRKGGGP